MVAEGRVGGATLQGTVGAVQNGQRALVLLAERVFSLVLVVVRLPRGWGGRGTRRTVERTRQAGAGFRVGAVSK